MVDDAVTIRAVIAAEGQDQSARTLVIDSVWDCLDAIICSDAVEPPIRAVIGGDPVSGIDERAVIALPADEVCRVAAVLDQMDFPAALRASQEAVEQLYGGSIVGEEDEDDFHALFNAVRDFYAQAASRQESVIKW